MAGKSKRKHEPEPVMEPEPEEQPTMRSLVREAWVENEGDMPGATEALFDRVRNDRALLGELLPVIVRAWCREQVDHHVGLMRLAAIQTVDDPSRGARLRSVIALSLFDFPLPGGKRLGDANAVEIREGAEAYGATAADAAHKQRWLLKVAARVGKKNRAEGAVTLVEITAWFEETRD